jgi:hypothetical protein
LPPRNDVPGMGVLRTRFNIPSSRENVTAIAMFE